jgi:hypothetical protein
VRSFDSFENPKGPRQDAAVDAVLLPTPSTGSENDLNQSMMTRRQDDLGAITVTEQLRRYFSATSSRIAQRIKRNAKQKGRLAVD